MNRESNLCIQRAIHKKNYIKLNLDVLYDKKDDQKPLLSLEAKGLLVMLLSLPENWSLTVQGLTTLCGCCDQKISRILRELKDSGLLIMKKHKAGCTYFLKETRNANLWDGNTVTNGYLLNGKTFYDFENMFDFSTKKRKNRQKIVTSDSQENCTDTTVNKGLEYDCNISKHLMMSNVPNNVNTTASSGFNKFCNKRNSKNSMKTVDFIDDETHYEKIINSGFNDRESLEQLINLKYIRSSFNHFVSSSNLQNNQIEEPESDFSSNKKLNYLKDTFRKRNLTIDQMEHLDQKNLQQVFSSSKNKKLGAGYYECSTELVGDHFLVKYESDESGAPKLTVISDGQQEDEINMKIPRVSKPPKGIKKEPEVQVPLSELLVDDNSIILSEQTTEEKIAANLKRQLNIEKEEKKILKARLGKASAAKKRIYSFIEQQYSDSDMCNVLADFAEMYMEKRGVLTVSTLKLLLEDLNGLTTDRDTQIEIIKNSIKHSYTQFYFKSDSKSSSSQNNPGTTTNIHKNTFKDSIDVKTDAGQFKINDSDFGFEQECY